MRALSRRPRARASRPLTPPRAQLKPPRLVFVGSKPDPAAHFFVLAFSRSGHRMTLVDPPAAVGDTIGLRLRSAFDPHVTHEGVVEDGIFVVELKRGVFGGASLSVFAFGGGSQCVGLTGGRRTRRARGRQDAVHGLRAQVHQAARVQARRERADGAHRRARVRRPQGDLDIQGPAAAPDEHRVSPGGRGVRMRTGERSTIFDDAEKV